MKSQKGVTLLSLVIYIIVLTIVVSILALISRSFFSNMSYVKDQATYAPEFNKFNMFFIQDIKNNTTATVNGNEIQFADGTRYTFNADQKEIYRNDKRIAKNVQVVIFTSRTETVRSTTKNIINVNMAIGNTNALFNKSIDYVLKYW